MRDKSFFTSLFICISHTFFRRFLSNLAICILWTHKAKKSDITKEREGAGGGVGLVVIATFGVWELGVVSQFILQSAVLRHFECICLLTHSTVLHILRTSSLIPTTMHSFFLYICYITSNSFNSLQESNVHVHMRSYLYM
jgi:hypothetical protein